MNRPLDESNGPDRLLSLVERYHTLRRRGHAVSPEELCEGDSGLAAELRRAVEAEERFHKLAEPESPPTALPGGPFDTTGPDHEASGRETESIPSTDRYEVLGKLGEGGMGAVFRARDRMLGREVALKVIRPDALTEELRKRFLTEARAVAALDHPHIVKVFDVGEWAPPGGAPRPFLSLEFVPGGSLSRHLQKGPMDPVESARLVRLLARAMAHAHGRGIVHRDLKPDNVLVAEPADEPGLNCLLGCPRVTDFGLALQQGVEQKQTRTGAVMGTPAYMAPEQAEGLPSGPASDVYALGGILYRLLTGKVAFDGPSAVEILFRVIRETPAPPRQIAPQIPTELDEVCLACLDKTPAKRPTASELARLLERFLEGRGEDPRRVEVAETAVLPPVRRAPSPARRAALAVGLVAAVALCGLAGWAIWPRPSSEANGEADRSGQTLPPAAPLTGELVVRVWAPARGVRGLRIGLDEGAVPLREDEQVQAAVALSEPAYAFLIMVDGKGEVSPLYPWNDERRTVDSIFAEPPARKGAKFLSPPIAHKGWELDDTTGLDTFLLLARREPWPKGRNLGELLGKVPGAPLRDPGEVVVRGWDGGRSVEAAALDLKRGLKKESAEIDDQLQRLVGRLSREFELIRAVQYAHVAKRR